MSSKRELGGEALLEALERGEVRVAEPSSVAPDGTASWVVNTWVKEALLDIFRQSTIVPHGIEEPRDPHARFAPHAFLDKEPFKVRRFSPESGVRLVPGGSAVRRGAHVGRGTVLMPPCYVNVGAFVGENSMIDSHALVGSCAQVGEGVHLSAAAQLGGVLEPAAARPVIVEDGAFIGGGVGIYEGVRVGAGAVIAAGVVLTAKTLVFDLVREELLAPASSAPQIPARAVVIPGTRPAKGQWAREQGLSQACALIVKYRDASTDAATALEEALRPRGGM